MIVTGDQSSAEAPSLPRNLHPHAQAVRRSQPVAGLICRISTLVLFIRGDKNAGGGLQRPFAPTLFFSVWLFAKY